MPETRCAATTIDGDACAARPLTDSDFCLFHDPAHQQALAESRSKGGAAPRRRIRRFPRVLDHVHVAELLGELLLDALNHPDSVDTQRLRALTHVCQVLLKAVGTPKNSFLYHRPHGEPPATEDHLLRIYAPEPSALGLASDAGPQDLNTRTPENLDTRIPEHPVPCPDRPTASGEQTLHLSDRSAYRGEALFFAAEPASAPAHKPMPKPSEEELSSLTKVMRQAC